MPTHPHLIPSSFLRTVAFGVVTIGAAASRPSLRKCQRVLCGGAAHCQAAATLRQSASSNPVCRSLWTPNPWSLPLDCTTLCLVPLAPQVHALHRLHAEVDFHWAEIAEVVSNIEELFEATDFPQRELAAAVASKVRGCPVVYRSTPQRAWARLRL